MGAYTAKNLAESDKSSLLKLMNGAVRFKLPSRTKDLRIPRNAS